MLVRLAKKAFFPTDVSVGKTVPELEIS